MTQLAESCASQVPSVWLYPPGDLDYELGDAALVWLDALGMTLFEWQRSVLRRALARRGRRWAAYEVDLIVPRQNGKNEILIALELVAANLLGVRLTIHSAHEAITAAKHFARFQELVNDDSPAYRPEIAKLFPRTKTRGFYTSNGKEHIEFANGALIEFRTRTKSAGRGFSAPLVVLDEAFDLPPKAVGSLQYTMRAKPNAQFWKTSSAAHADSVVLHNDRRRADAADPEDSRLLYMEWGNEPGCDPSDPETWLRSNPSIGCVAPGFNLELQTFRNEYASAKGDPELLAEFVREVCGVPEPPLGSGADSVIPNWDSLADGPNPETGYEGSKIASDRQWALAVSPVENGPQWASLGIAGRTADGRLQVEWMDHRKGTAWIVPRVVEAQKTTGIPIRVHAQGPEGALISSLREAGVEVDEVSSADMERATGLLIAAASGDDESAPSLVHLGQRSLDKAVRGAVLRTGVNGAASWSQRSSSVEITPLKAVTVALGGVPQESSTVYAGSFSDLEDFLVDEEA